MTARQSFEVGSQWPLYASEVYFELQMLRYAAEQGFQPGRMTKKNKDKRMTGKVYELGCSQPDCPFSVSLYASSKLAECVTTDVNLTHNHPYDGGGPSRQAIEKAEGRLMEAAKTELAKLRAPADYREGFEEEEAKEVLPPSCEQECVLWDLRDVWGEAKVRELEKQFREEDLLANDYPNPSTFDGPHPLTAPREERLPRQQATTTAVKVSDKRKKPGEDRELRKRKPNAAKKSFPKISSSDEETSKVKVGKKRVVHTTPPVIPPFIQATKEWDLKAFEPHLDAYTRANGFSTKKHSSDSPRLTYFCTVASCGWKIILKPRFGSQAWLVDEGGSHFAHKHQAGAGNGTVKVTAETKPEANLGDPSTFRLPAEYKLPVSKIDVEKVAVRYTEEPNDEVVAIDSRVAPPASKRPPPRGRGKSVPPPFVPAPTFDEIDADEPQEQRSPTFIAQPQSPSTPSYAAGAPDGPMPPYYGAFLPPAPWTGYWPPQYAPRQFLPPHYGPSPVPQTPAYPHTAPHSPYLFAQPARPVTLEEYLAELDPAHLFDYSSYGPVLRHAGVEEAAQLERFADGHLDKVAKVLRRADEADELRLEAFLDDLKVRVEDKQARSKRSDAPSWVKESQ